MTLTSLSRSSPSLLFLLYLPVECQCLLDNEMWKTSDVRFCIPVSSGTVCMYVNVYVTLSSIGSATTINNRCWLLVRLFSRNTFNAATIPIQFIETVNELLYISYLSLLFSSLLFPHVLLGSSDSAISPRRKKKSNSTRTSAANWNDWKISSANQVEAEQWIFLRK